MGKSRSATVCIAYLLHQQRSGLTPQSALEVIRQSRPLCEPNDGFMEQLNLYHEMGCPDEVADHPVYQRWLYRREVEESVACGRAPELKSVRFEDEQPQRPQEPAAQVVEIKCRKCRFVFPPQCGIGFRETNFVEGAESLIPSTLFLTTRRRKRVTSIGRIRNANMCSYTP